MYQVLARKWRPQRLEELVGQSHVARTLRNAIEARRIAHAYLFSGIRGTGKTTVARILAKCLNCEQGPTSSPCNECTPCREITEGRSMDVMELDAASRTRVEEMRELQEVIPYAPVRDRYKVVILDEVHMLSRHAFNALLKTLEEPPPSVIFVLATTELQKVLPTILSRCQVFEFRRVPQRDVAAHLRKVCDAEGIRISDTTLDRVARAGEGSVRDALSVLERVLAFCGGEVSDEDALVVLGGVRAEALVGLVRALSRRDAAAMLGVLEEVVEEGHDLVHFWSELVGALRDLLLLRALPGREDLLDRSSEEATALAEASGGLSREDLLRAFQQVADLELPLRGSSQPRFLFEAALVRLAALGAVRPIEEILSTLDAGGVTTAPSGPSSGGAIAAPQKKKSGDPSLSATASSSPFRPPAPMVEETPAGPPMERFRAALRASRPMLAAALDRAASVAVVADRLVVTFEPATDAVRKVVERGESLTAIAQVAGEAFGRRLDVRLESAAAPAGPVTTGSPSEPPRVSAGDTGAAGPRASAEPPTSTGQAPDRLSLLDRARSEPGVRKLLAEFGAQVVDIRPLEAARPLDPAAPDVGPPEESP